MKLLLFSVILLFINVSCFGTITEKEETDKIVYIKIKLDEGQPSDISYEVVPGKVKTPKVKEYKPNELFYEIVLDDNSILIDGVVDDPSNNKYEFVDESGKLNTVDVKQDNAEAVVRVNYNKKIVKINFFKTPDDQSLQKSKDKFLPLASFPINLD